MSGRTGLLLALIVAGAALTYAVTERLSEQTIDVVVGLVCGLTASVPAVIGLLIALTRRQRESVEDDEESSKFPNTGSPYEGYTPRQPYPPVIVITPQHGQMPNPFGGFLPPGQSPIGYNMNEAPITREFRIIGEDDDGFDA